MMKNYFFVLLCLIVSGMQASARTVLDQNGIAVEVPEQISRVVTIPIPMASMLITIDESTQRLVAVNRSSHNDFVEGFLSTIYPEVVNIPYDIASDSFVPSIETLAKLHPDVVLQWGDRGDAIVKPIKDTGFPVLTMRYGETSYVADWMRMTGNLLGKSERGNKLANWFMENYKLLENKVTAVGSKDKPKVVYLYRYASGFTVAGKGTSYQGDITIAGGKNMAESLSGFAPVNVEQLLIWNPDIILLNNFEGNITPEMIYQDNRLQHVSALINKQVYVYPRGGFRWDPPSQESVLSLHWLSVLFHPQQKTENFRQKIRETYQLLYNYNLTEQQIDRILRMHDNQGSANYCQLFCGHQ